MLKRWFSLAIGVLLSLAAADAMAMGFGRISNATSLGQTLDLVVGVRLDADESLAPECVAVEVHAGESRVPASAVRVVIEAAGDPAERKLRIVTSSVIDEPVVDVDLQIGCAMRLSRKFVVFIDPPVINLAQASESVARAPEPAAPATARRGLPPAEVATAAAGSTRVAATPTQATPRRREAAPARRTVHVGAQVPAPAASAVRSTPARANPPVARTVRAPPAPAGARLKLEPVEAARAKSREPLNQRQAGGQPLPAASAASDVAASPPVPDEAAVQRAKERELLLAMEDSLTKLRAESRATQQSIAQLQLRLQEADGQRYSNPLVFALAALATALAAVVGVLVWKRASERRAGPNWWAPPTGTSAAGAVSVGMTDHDWFSPQPDAGGPALVAPPPTPVETTASPRMLPSTSSLAMADLMLSAAPPEREMSVEELIDLEQQAEFFVALGQDDAAIELLMGHLRSSGGASPLPYLKLLELYRRRGEREAFERIREPFNRRFNAYVHDWQSDPQMGRTLLDYPNASSKLQALWAKPEQTMKAIEASLFRRDADSPTFDLPAYRELLFLYSVARDLSEHEVAVDSVDLLLPMGGDSPKEPPVTRMHATPAAGASLQSATEVDVDVTRLEAGPDDTDDRPSRYHVDFSTSLGSIGPPRDPDPKSGR